MPVGQTKDAGFQIGVSRTVAGQPDVVWELLTGAVGLAVWLGEGAVLGTERGTPYRTADGTSGQLRSRHAVDRVRLTWRPASWSHDTTLQVTVRPGAEGRTSVRFHQDRLAGPEEREQQRAHWAGVLDRLERELLSGR